MSYSFTFNRPLSPHILIYTPNWSLMRSIVHRISGVCLTLSFIFLIYINEIATGFSHMFLVFVFWKYISYVFFVLLTNFFFSFFIYHFVSGLFHLYINILSNYDF